MMSGCKAAAQRNWCERQMPTDNPADPADQPRDRRRSVPERTHRGMAPITRRTFQLPRPRPVRHPALRRNGRYSARREGVNRVAAQRISAQLRSAAWVRRATPRRIHGVRLAMTSTARSDRRIAVRGPGVGIDASAASALPARAPRRSTARYAGSGRIE